MSEDEPERAYEHAKVARRFAGRIGIIREATGIAAYRAGQYAEALADLRAARRMTGSDAYLPVMADCERGLGRPERALDLVRSKEAERLDREGKIELAIVESGARRDMGQFDAAVVTLQRLTELRDPQRRAWSVRLAYAYADALAAAGHETAATDWFERAMTFDEDGETDAAERYAELTGAVIEDLEEDFDEDDDAIEGEGDDDLAGDLGDEAAADAVGDLATNPRDVEADSADAGADDLDDDLDDEDDEDDAPDAEPGDESGDVRMVGDILDDLPQERGSAASRAAEETPIATAPQAPETKADEAEPASAQAEDGVADLPAEAGKPVSVEAEKATAVDADKVATEPAGIVSEPKNEVSAFGPAFIEPDFGDVIEDAEDDEDAEDADGGVKRQP
ncbi:hypothetical protein Psi02_45450 [Planotetraspora silvatica]|uniref:Tetratricopeptide repeat protein n=1 Tax=Planotetraspora silvatica TaxID=234614 RepID=A0A8J3URG1_9ACTN|nr:hypothetical protein [Planotetraspora silvatica]GII48121.1 hypothetical protein Psi02_45450 [Planotetraspora silvatica]